MPLSEQRFEQLVELGELGGVEFKSSLPLDRRRAAKTLRAALGLSNRRDGGWIIIGIREEGAVPNFDGMSEVDLATWDQDQLIALLSEFGEPNPEVRLHRPEFSGKSFVVIEVSEFHELPVICSKDYGDDLHRGSLYIRPRGRAETVRVGRVEDMRELIELAVEKRLRSLLATVERAGGLVVGTERARGVPTDDELYDRELGDFQ